MQKNGKKILYIGLFALLGLLLQFIVHAVLEIGYIFLLLTDFSVWSFGFSWEQWEHIHLFVSMFLAIGGVVFGIWCGIYWWKRIYGNK